MVVSTIYVYCDTVEPQVVGNTGAQLLRSIPAEGKFGDVIAKTFPSIQYVPVQTKSFEDVEVLLRSDTGDPDQCRCSEAFHSKLAMGRWGFVLVACFIALQERSCR